MPDNVSSGFDKGYVDLSGAPGADKSWDEMFLNPETTPAVPATSNGQGTNPPQAPQATQESAPFLKAGDTVYMTAEDAARGTEHKDALIARYRTYLTDNGIDPNELKRAQAQPQAPAQASNSQYKYLENGKLYYDDLSDAVKRHDEKAYGDITRRFQQEVIQSTLAPYAPLLAESARQRAIRRVSTEIPEFTKFMESADFKRTTDSIPLYKEMLQIGENDPTASERLPEVYKAIYLTFQGLNRSAQVQQAPVIQAPPVTNTPTARPVPTMSQSTLTPPPQGRDTRTWSTDREARKQLIQDGEARGIDRADWSALGT